MNHLLTLYWEEVRYPSANSFKALQSTFCKWNMLDGRNLLDLLMRPFSRELYFNQMEDLQRFDWLMRQRWRPDNVTPNAHRAQVARFWNFPQSHHLSCQEALIQAEAKQQSAKLVKEKWHRVRHYWHVGFKHQSKQIVRMWWRPISQKEKIA